MIILLFIVLAIIAGILYRMGGTSKGTNWRDVGLPVLTTVSFLVLGLKSQIWGIYGPLIAIVAAFGMLLGALKTYWDFLFGYDNFWFSGLIVGLSGFPVALYQGKFIGCLLRMGIIAGVWQALNKLLPQKVLWWTRDIVEEFGRGFITMITLPLLYF